MQHVAMPPANDGIAQYSNSVLFGPSHGRWIGYDTVEYVNEDLVSGSVAAIDGQRLVLSGVPDHGDGPASGTLWIAAEVTLTNGDRLRTPDAAAVDRLGLTPAVARVSFRDDDSTLGWLSTYFHVPNVFGSTGVQVDRYVGADCADVLVGARRAAGRRLAYTSASALATTAAPVTPPLFLGPDGKVRDEDGRPVVMRWGEDVEPGDFLVIDYTRAGADLPRAWDHIGALVGDDPASREGRGILDGADLLRHMSPRGLVDQPLRVQGEIRLRVVRL